MRRYAFLRNGTLGSSMTEMMTLRFFGIQQKFRKGHLIREIFWKTPPPKWYKANTGGAALGQPGTAAWGGIFRMFRGFSAGTSAMLLGIQTALYAEIGGLIQVVEIAQVKGWFLLSLETDSSVLVDKVMIIIGAVPWKLKTRWKKCIDVLYGSAFKISHIYREENGVADVMANIGLALKILHNGMVCETRI